jgi:cytochrome c553
MTCPFQASRLVLEGVHPEDAWGPVMRQIAVALGDVSMENVVAYIQTLRKESTTNEDI